MESSDRPGCCGALAGDGLPASAGMKGLYLKLVLTAIFWGGTFVAGRVVSRDVGPFSAAFLRFVVASAFLTAFVLKTHGRLPSVEKNQVPFLVLLGLTGVFAYNAFFFSGLKTVTAGRASLIIASNPAFIALFASLVFGERLGLGRAGGIVLSVIGAMVVISHGNPLSLLHGQLGRGELYIFGAVVSWVTYSLVGKVALRRLSPLVTVAYACGIGCGLLVVPAFMEGMFASLIFYPPAAWTGIAYLGFFGSALGFIWYYEGIQTIGPARAGVFINLVPVSSILLASLFLGEGLDLSLAMGALFVISGVYLTNRAPVR